MQNMNPKRPRWLTPVKLAMAVSLLTFIAGRLIPYWASPTKDALHSVEIRGRGFTAFLTPDQHLWCDRLSTYGFSMMIISGIVFVAFAFTLYRRH
jgi:hypothetical protein